MKFNCERSDLMAGINAALKAVSTSDKTLPALRGILVEARGLLIRLTGNCLESAIVTTIPGMATEEGKVLVDGKLFSEIVKKLPNGDVSFSAEGAVVSMKCGKAKFQMSVMDAEQFPKFPAMEEGVSVTLKEPDFKALVSGSLFCADPSAQSKLMQGGYLEAEAGRLRMTALDGHRIGVCVRPAVLSDEKGFKACVPYKALSDALKQANDEGDMTITVSPNHVLFHFKENDVRIVSRLYDGDYFKVDMLMKAEPVLTLTMDKNKLADCIGRGTIFSKGDVKKPVILNIRETVHVSAKSNVGEMDEELEPESREGKPIRIGFAPAYLLEPLKCIADSSVKIEFSGAKSPAKYVSANGEYTYLILPVNIQ